MQQIDQKTLNRRQAWPLDRKVAESIERIKEWYLAFDGNVSVSFSGGLDSTVLVDLVRSVYPEVPGVFCNTGLEYPEIVLFVKTIPNVTTIRPKMPFHKVVEKWGYPVISKRVAQYIYEVRTAKGYSATKQLRLTGIKQDGRRSPMSMIPLKWQYLCDAPFKISDKCCSELKKKPFNKYHKKTGRYPYIGMLADDSKLRLQAYYRYGCNRFDSKRPQSNPLSFWRHQDILDYIKINKLRYSKIYDMGHNHTGCMFCMFGVHIDTARTGTNRFMLMKDSHPRQWKYCIERLGIGEVMEYIGVPYEDKQLKLFGT